MLFGANSLSVTSKLPPEIYMLPETRTPIRVFQGEAGELPKKHLNLLGLTIQKAYLAVVTTKLGTTNQQKGQHAGSKTVCYTGHGKTRVEFWEDSSGYGYIVYDRTQSIVPSLDCMLLDQMPVEVGNAAGIYLGQTKDAVIASMGASHNNDAGRSTFYYWIKRQVGENEAHRIIEGFRLLENEFPTNFTYKFYYDLSSYLTMHFNEDRSVKFSIVQRKTW